MRQNIFSTRHSFQTAIKVFFILIIPSLLILNVADALAADSHSPMGQNPIKAKWSRGLVCMKVIRPMQNRDRIA